MKLGRDCACIMSVGIKEHVGSVGALKHDDGILEDVMLQE